MFALVFGAVRTRAAQVLTILVLTALAAAVAAAGPWYAFAAVGEAATAYLEVAPPAQRTVSVQSRIETQGKAEAELAEFTDQVVSGLPAGLGDGLAGMAGPVSVRTGPASTSMPVAYRDGFCEHVRLTGSCPAARGEIAISHEAAQRLGIRAGEVLSIVTTTASGRLDMRVVALYALVDPGGTYWANRLFRPEATLDPAFTTVDTFTHRQLWVPTMAYDVVVPDAMLRGDGGRDFVAEIDAADLRLGQVQLRMGTQARPLHQAITNDRYTILTGVLTAGVQMLILTWFAVGLAGWFTLRERRADAALLKLRGVSRFGMLRLAWGQHLVPLILGVLAGVPAGYLLARGLAGPVTVAPDREAALVFCAAAVAAVLFGSLAVLAAVEATVLGRPVSALLTRAGSIRGAWRPAVVDVLLMVIAAAAVYQARTTGAGYGLGPAAPALVALAVGLLAARLLSRAAARGGGAALRAGRLRTGLTALRFSRAPGTDRVFALLVVAVALFTTAAGGWRAESGSRADRSIADLGAERVLTVEAINRTALLHAVRGVDPGGREAMAAVWNRGNVQEVLEVDTARLAAVTTWRPEYGPASRFPDAVAEDTRPPMPLVTEDSLTLRVRREGPAVALALQLQHEGTGLPVTAGFGMLPAGEHTVTVPVSGCTEAPGCRIVRWELTTPPDRNRRIDPPPPGASATVLRLGQGGTDTGVLDAALLGDISRWRAATTGAALDVTAADGTLRLAADSNPTEVIRPGAEAWTSDTLPMPALLAGPAPEDWLDTEPTLMAYGEALPLRVLDQVAALPVVGRGGLMIDLDAARRFAAESDPGGEYQVWLAPGARPGIVADLTAAGLTVTGDATAAGYADRLGAQGPAVVVRFALVAGVAALLLAAAMLAVAVTVDRRSLAEQLAALRVQGLTRRTAVGTGYAGTVALVLAGLLGGVLAGLLAVALTDWTVPPFTDGWAVLAPPGPLDAAAVALAALGSLVVLGLAAWLALAPLIRGMHEGHTRGEGR
ncbi:FtsX-like permease family protein [Actinoplanes aureus]|uniref:ABC transporter permease n=1 Tax=Actinoplanes aureus TaxID=2792083 RepID=A0A931C319_9ACTN|nr:FtsX-like permease family protein [Actinoplanes aureus]MBG0560196.1 ABC transporter permease [Actinoplanes aureus]